MVGAETEIKGRACWTGTIDALATSPKDSGYTWKNTGTYVDGNDKADNLYYRCVGIGGVIAGKPQKISWWCLGHTSDDSTVLWRGESNKDSSSTEQYISGTGRYEGVTGTLNGSVLMPAFKPW